MVINITCFCSLQFLLKVVCKDVVGVADVFFFFFCARLVVSGWVVMVFDLALSAVCCCRPSLLFSPISHRLVSHCTLPSSFRTLSLATPPPQPGPVTLLRRRISNCSTAEQICRRCTGSSAYRGCRTGFHVVISGDKREKEETCFLEVEHHTPTFLYRVLVLHKAEVALERRAFLELATWVMPFPIETKVVLLFQGFS